MLHSTTYNLKSSFTKQIIAGAEFQKGGTLTSSVKLPGESSSSKHIFQSRRAEII